LSFVVIWFRSKVQACEKYFPIEGTIYYCQSVFYLSYLLWSKCSWGSTKHVIIGINFTVSPIHWMFS